MTLPLRRVLTGVLAIPLALVVSVTASFAANRDDVVDFLKTTGFDVAIASIADGAEGAPNMLGLQDDAFGANWLKLTEDIFVPEEMQEEAVSILEATLEQDLLDHAAAFYASELGQRLVKAENLSYGDEDDIKQIAGRQIIAGMLADGDPKGDAFSRMNDAIDPEDVGLQSIQEIQIRFLMAASRAGVIRQDLDEDMLRAQIRENEAQTREALRASALASAAYTYQGFTLEEVETYAEALEHPKMKLVYELMNAVHFQIMGDRFDTLATHLGKMQPSEEL
jgi:hypothetical protein